MAKYLEMAADITIDLESLFGKKKEPNEKLDEAPKGEKEETKQEED